MKRSPASGNSDRHVKSIADHVVEKAKESGFRPLGKEQLVKIIELRLEDLRRLLAERKISIELTDAAKELLFTEGFDPNFGARPLKRILQQRIAHPYPPLLKTTERDPAIHFGLATPSPYREGGS